MKVVHIARTYGLNGTGGAAIAATRLHLALLEGGVDSHFICVDQREEALNVYVLPKKGTLLRWMRTFCTRASIFIWRRFFYKKFMTLNLFPLFGLEEKLKEIQPDVIHIHWINIDVLRYEQLASLKGSFPKAKFVINLHDLFMINAIDPCPWNDVRYQTGFAKSNSRFLERWLFARKMKAMNQLKPVFVGPSDWVVSCSRKSIIGRVYPAFAIPNIIGTNVFFYRDDYSSHSKFRVLFGVAGGRENPYKGFDDFRAALRILPYEIKEGIELQIFGESSSDKTIEGISVKFWGAITNPSELAEIYRQADVFAFPSKQETQGMTKVEAMLCGLPVVAFDRTACAEGIVPQETGSVAETVADFANELMLWYAKWKDDAIDHVQIASKARQINAEDNILHQIKAVYSMTNNRVVPAAAECRVAPPPGGGGV